MAGPQQTIQYDAPAAPPSVLQYDGEQQQEEKPGFLRRLGQSIGIPTSGEELESAITPPRVGHVPIAAPASGLGFALTFGKNLYNKGAQFIQHPSVESGADAVFAMTPGGESQKSFAKDVVDKNLPGAAGTATGTALQFAMPEIAERTEPYVNKIARTGYEVGRGSAKIADIGTFERISKGAQALKDTTGRVREIWNPSGPEPIKPTPPADVYRPGYRTPRAFYGGQPPQPIPARSGLLLEGEVARPQVEPINPAVTSPARTLPGQISPEVIRPKIAAPKPISTRTGLALPAAPESIAGSMARSVAEEPKPIREAAAEPEAAPPAMAARPPRLPNDARGITNVPEVWNGESALRQVLPKNNQDLLRIAKSRGINVSKESMLKPAAADKLLVNKIIDDFSPDELDEVYARYQENSRFRHNFGDIGPEAWNTLGLDTFLPDVKIPMARVMRTQKAIQTAAAPKFSPIGDLASELKDSAAAKTASVAKPTGKADPQPIADENLAPEWQRNLEHIEQLKAAKAKKTAKQ